jgi:hypothetical protein
MTDTKRKRRKSAAGKYRLFLPPSIRPAAGVGDRPPPDEALEERDLALAALAELPAGEQHLGSPAPSRSALSRQERKSRFSEAFLLRTPWADDR